MPEEQERNRLQKTHIRMDLLHQLELSTTTNLLVLDVFFPFRCKEQRISGRFQVELMVVESITVRKSGAGGYQGCSKIQQGGT